MGQKLKKAFYMREAIRQYNTALAEPFENDTLRAILHSNRAQAESLLGNWGNALRDATAALRFDPGNVKVGSRDLGIACWCAPFLGALCAILHVDTRVVQHTHD